MMTLTRYIALALLLGSLGCGTDTGNPPLKPGFGRDSGNAGNSDVFAEMLKNNVCLKIISCGAIVSETSCHQSISQLSNLAEPLGLNDNDFANYQEVIDAEIGGHIEVNNDSADECLENLSRLTCESDAVKNAYASEAPIPFAGVKELLPESCEDAFYYP